MLILLSVIFYLLEVDYEIFDEIGYSYVSIMRSVSNRVFEIDCCRQG